MGFNPPVPQQDGNWEIRVAVLLSLLLQVLLIFVAPTRKRCRSGQFPRSVVWPCYLLADWVADLALGLLLCSMGSVGTNNNGGSGSPGIFAFWTPFLLLHLGGPDTITAYSVEDNELWFRHLIGLLFELFSAAMVIFNSLQDNPLISATMLMLVAGVIKYGERTYSLYSSSAGSLRDSMLGVPDPGPDYTKPMEEANDNSNSTSSAHKDAEEQEAEMPPEAPNKLMSIESRAFHFFLSFQRLFVDPSHLSAQQRRPAFSFFVQREDIRPAELIEVVELELNFVYDTMLTKLPVALTRAGWAIRSVCSVCLVSALIIFFLLDKSLHQIMPVDVGITYALLLGGLALDVAALPVLFLSDRSTVLLEESQRFRCLQRLGQALRQWWRPRRWSQSAEKLNLISHCMGLGKMERKSGSRAWTRLIMVADKLGIDLEFMWAFRRVTLSNRLLDFIVQSLKDDAAGLTWLEGKENIMDVCSRRGKGVVNRLERQIKENGGGKSSSFDLILDSVVKADYEESLLLWHVATDLCRLKGEHSKAAETDKEARLRSVSETLSEYMLYLVIMRPQMLSATGIALIRYRDTFMEARRFFGYMGAWIDDREDACKMLLRVNTSQKPSRVKGDRSKSVLFDAVILAKALRELNNDELMWEVVTGVWMEMMEKNFLQESCTAASLQDGLKRRRVA
ncbi:unnamed protein product [Urochloa decumbens]|uniref:DUF4220 domain-containing protein n=1 Tax=Urochloa decumbens TaxID=240449 RepID=A0ABC9G886_9POAL